MSITSIENFSNEIFYEIFNYLDGFEIYQAFANLNHEFQHLFNSSVLRFKICINSSSNKTYTKKCEQLLHMNHQQIVSLGVSLSTEKHDFFSLYIQLIYLLIWNHLLYMTFRHKYLFQFLLI